MKSSMRMRSVVEPFDEDPEDPDGDRKKGAAQWSAHDALPLVVLTLCALILVVLVATGARMHEPTMYDLAAKLLWKNATVRPPVMLFFVVAGWAWVVRLCRSRGMKIELVLTGTVQPAAATQDAALGLGLGLGIGLGLGLRGAALVTHLALPTRTSPLTLDP